MVLSCEMFVFQFLTDVVSDFQVQVDITFVSCCDLVVFGGSNYECFRNIL